MEMTALLMATQTEQASKTFYPTPEALANQLLAGIDWLKVSSVLEPSAGKGDLARPIAYTLYQRRKGYHPYDEHSRSAAIQTADIDCVEIDPFLRTYLDGAGYRVVHDDFLTFETHKRYDLVVMNPPFDHGAEHLLHALELMRHGGEVRCILNAETIRNPYTAVRQRLIKALQEDAEITYVSGAFGDAERSTPVDVAIIKKTIAYQKPDSTIMEDMQKAPTYKTQTIPPAYTEIVRYNKIDEWVNRYNYEVACGIKLITEYNTMVPLILSDPMEQYHYPVLSLKMQTENGRDLDANINGYIQQTRGHYWRMIFQQKTFTACLTSNLLNELQNNVRKLMDYEFSAYNILTLLIKMNQKVIMGVEQTIIALFDDWTRLHWHEESPNRHYFDGWKTNDCFAVGKKVILPFYGAYDSWDHRFRSYNVYQRFNDIEKVFDFLDSGRTNWPGSLNDALSRAESIGNTRNIDTKYFTATFFKKGTAHLVFKDAKLLEKFNLFAAQNKNWLPPCYGKKQYQDMTPEEQCVIDSFQGEERYAHVMAHADYYLPSNTPTPFLLCAAASA